MESAKERAAKEAIIASQPFARNDIDEDFDKELKDTIRWDDPILMFDTEKRKKTIEQKSDGKPKCRFHAPPNRFNIPPGYRWDGVIRGNGYEERRFRVSILDNIKQIIQSMKEYNLFTLKTSFI